MPEPYKRWTDLPYAGEKIPPTNSEEPLCQSWSTHYIRLDPDGTIRDLEGNIMPVAIQHPDAIDWDKQLKAVQKTGRALTEKQIRIARYWGTGVPTKQFTPIIDRLIDTYGITASRAARILTVVQAGINDTMVVTWYYKYLWNVARPNQLDQKLATVLCTPRHPSYVAGHATVAGCAEVILSHFFPAEAPRLKELAEECALSRLYAGVHFPADNEEGLRLGRAIGQIVVDACKKQKDSNSNPIDVPVLKNRHAKLQPPSYQQAIPFSFKGSCTSKIRKREDEDDDDD